jgi:hypothetical protein
MADAHIIQGQTRPGNSTNLSHYHRQSMRGEKAAPPQSNRCDVDEIYDEVSTLEHGQVYVRQERVPGNVAACSPSFAALQNGKAR